MKLLFVLSPLRKLGFFLQVKFDFLKNKLKTHVKIIFIPVVISLPFPFWIRASNVG